MNLVPNFKNTLFNDNVKEGEIDVLKEDPYTELQGH